ncbi:hypothetical protein [Butyrivibrio sp. WCD2001]|uniref:hypothetical protein n=1 Tax=Butyrivibrio sp. WCD2001 TaxID=1280681 RepID=UPI00041EA5AE|nr:hypothetical protein [Butyrivibrio sp. WCD2001]
MMSALTKKQILAIAAAAGSFLITVTTIIANVGTISSFMDRGIKPSDLNIKQDVITITVQQGKIPIEYEVSPLNASDNYLHWNVEDESVANVENGILVGKKCGNTKLSVYTDTGLVDDALVYVSDADKNFFEFINDARVFSVSSGTNLLAYFSTGMEWDNYGFPSGDANVDIKIVNDNDKVVYDKVIPLEYSDYQKMIYATIKKDEIEFGDNPYGKYVFEFINANSGYRSRKFEYPISFPDGTAIYSLPEKIIYENINVADGINIAKIEINNETCCIDLICDGKNVGLEWFTSKMLVNAATHKCDIDIISGDNKGHMGVNYSSGIIRNDEPVNWNSHDITAEDKEKVLNSLIYFIKTHPKLNLSESSLLSQRYRHFVD